MGGGGNFNSTCGPGASRPVERRRETAHSQGTLRLICPDRLLLNVSVFDAVDLKRNHGSASQPIRDGVLCQHDLLARNQEVATVFPFLNSSSCSTQHVPVCMNS